MPNSKKRETWASRIDFLLSCVGCCVGFGNVWRFSYLCYKNGGGAFVLPYLCCIIIIGFPILFLEVAIGQYTQKGAVGIWDTCPLMKGIGYSTLVFGCMLCTYYNIILAWVGHYFVVSFTSELPWTNCNNDWNTDNCTLKQTVNISESQRQQELFQNVSDSTTGQYLPVVNFTADGNGTEVLHEAASPAEEYWWRGVLQLSEGIDKPGEVCVHLVASLAVCWVAIYFCVFKGVRWSGKVVYFTATFPYVLIIALLIQAARQEGAITGVTYYMKPQFDRLADIKVWFDAASQVLFSYAVSIGVLPAYGSYCPFNGNCLRDSILVAIANSGTSFLVGFVVFATLGHMAHVQNETIADVATSGPGLAFIVYPQALSLLPAPQVWSVLFFFMMILVGLDSQFANVEGVMAALWDVFPRWYRHRMLVLLVFSVSAFLLGITMITQGGMYVFQLIDYYVCGAYTWQILSLLEVITVAWIYGVNRFYDNIETMIGYRISVWMKICWKFLTPASLTLIVLFNLATYGPLTYNKTYVFPAWANGLGFLLTILVLIFIPLCLVITLVRTPADTLRERFRIATRSKVDHSSFKRDRQEVEMENNGIMTEQEKVFLS